MSSFFGDSFYIGFTSSFFSTLGSTFYTFLDSSFFLYAGSSSIYISSHKSSVSFSRLFCLISSRPFLVPLSSGSTNPFYFPISYSVFSIALAEDINISFVGLLGQALKNGIPLSELYLIFLS